MFLLHETFTKDTVTTIVVAVFCFASLMVAGSEGGRVTKEVGHGIEARKRVATELGE